MNFRPPIGLRNPHIQTIFSSIGPRALKVRREFDAFRLNEQPVILECGKGVRLGGVLNRAPASSKNHLVILVHGWEGSADSSYMLSLASTCLKAGMDVFRLNMRDHGDTHHLNEGLFNSTLIDEVIGAVRDIQRRFVYPHTSLVGFSLGGNFALRVAAQGGKVGIKLKNVIAFCPVLHAKQSNQALALKKNAVYDRYFVRKWKRSMRKKDAAFSHHNFSALLPELKELNQMNQVLIPLFTEYENIDDYFDDYAITGDVLAHTICPCFLHFAKDDMIIPWQDVENLADNPHLDIKVTERGGHCGFLKNWRFDSWQDERALNVLLDKR